MGKKFNWTVVFLVVLTIGLAILSLFIAIKLKEKKSQVGIIKTKATTQTYKKVVQLGSNTPTIQQQFSETNQIFPTTAPTTFILVEQSPTPTKFIIEPTVEVFDGLITETPTPTKKITSQLPQSGIVHLTSIIFFTAIGMIFFSFIL